MGVIFFLFYQRLFMIIIVITIMSIFRRLCLKMHKHGQALAEDRDCDSC